MDQASSIIYQLQVIHINDLDEEPDYYQYKIPIGFIP